MDYRDRNPQISYWRIGSNDLVRDSYPYEGPNVTSIQEFISPDYSAVFLSLLGGFAEDENYNISSHYYLIESPKTCVMRQAFEIGELSWEDFWHHKGWLIEATSTSIFSDGFHIRYVHPSSMSSGAYKKICKFSGKSPLQHKYESLCRMRKGNDLCQTGAAQLEELERKFSDVLKAAA